MDSKTHNFAFRFYLIDIILKGLINKIMQFLLTVNTARNIELTCGSLFFNFWDEQFVSAEFLLLRLGAESKRKVGKLINFQVLSGSYQSVQCCWTMWGQNLL